MGREPYNEEFLAYTCYNTFNLYLPTVHVITQEWFSCGALDACAFAHAGDFLQIRARLRWAANTYSSV